MKRSSHRNTAFVLHKRRYRENSFLVDLLTEDSERVNAVAPGVRKQGKSSIDLLTKYEVGWRGTGTLVTLTQYETVKPFHITGKRLFAAMYLNELLIKSVRERDSVAGAFEIYEKALTDLVTVNDRFYLCLRNFERQLLQCLGYEISFAMDARGVAIDPNRRYSFQCDTGFIPVESDDPDFYQGSALLAIDANDLADANTRKIAKILLQQVFTSVLGEQSTNAGKHFSEAFTSINEHG